MGMHADDNAGEGDTPIHRLVVDGGDGGDAMDDSDGNSGDGASNGAEKDGGTRGGGSALRGVLHATGWLSFSVVFNVLNTVCYSALYPVVLEQIAHGDEYLRAYSIVNFFTTLASAAVLPVLGSLTDCLQIIKPCMLVMQYVGVACTLGIVALDWLPDSPTWNTAHLSANMVLYVLAMFFLRTAVMNNNSMLVSFRKKSMNILSLMANLTGYTINMGGLALLFLYPKQYFIPDKFLGITQANWWMLLYTAVVVLVSPMTLLSPSAKTGDAPSAQDGSKNINNNNNNNNNNKRGIVHTLNVVKTVFRNTAETMINWRSNAEYYKCWLFLMSYLFFSTAGTVMTIYIGPLFIELYKLSLEDEVAINLYYKVAMVAGVLGGMAYDRFCNALKTSWKMELVTLTFHAVIFSVQIAVMFYLITLEFSYPVVLFMALAIGFMYAWNMSIARSIFSKLVPAKKKAEFMGLYSSTTYLGISAVSLVNLILRTFQFPPQVLFAAVFLWGLPAFVLLFLLYRALKKEEGVKARHQIDDEEDEEKRPIIAAMQHGVVTTTVNDSEVACETENDSFYP